MSDEAPVARAIGVKNVKTAELHQNPHNPRLLFDRVNMDPLEDSIGRVGILVPLTVYKEKKTGRYIILDGQRRWMCAQAVNLPTVPVNEVEEPTLVQNIVTMFQIHKLRLDWELMPTALKLELLMHEVNDKSVSRLAALTGLDQAMVVRCKKLLSFPKKYQDMMLDANPDKRIKADFFIELYPVLHDRQIKQYDWFKPSSFTEAMLEKHKVKKLKAVTEFRYVKQQLNNSVKARKTVVMGRRLKEFAEDTSLTIAHLELVTIKTATTALKISKAAKELYDAVEDIDTDEYYGETDMWGTLEKLSTLIRARLKQLGRRIDK
ncbi:MAG: ParB N-terminal domain-containing protein [Steroidobacteraceae bacterium]